jgi:type II secretory pathway component PulJ
MRMTSFRPARAAAGFSLVELMVAMLAGLIIIGAAVTFAVSTMRSYSENILSSRLTQELRTGMNLVVRELRRAGHDSTSVSRVLTTTSASSFDVLEVTDDCIVYEYDRNVGADGPDATEMRGFRVQGGVLQLNASSGAIDCDGADDWEDITDPDVVQVTKFDPEMVESEFCAQVAERDPDPSDGVDETVYDMAYGSVRTISLCLQGRMVSRDDITRHVTDSVRVRAEDLRFDLGVADNTCAPAAVDPKTTIDLNDECAAILP